MNDQWGYEELVIYPPPMCFFTCFLTPFVFKKEWMKAVSRIYSQIAYWQENMFLIVFFLLYCLSLIPVVYYKILFNILRIGSLVNTLMLVPVWLIFGPLFLIYALVMDMRYFINSLAITHA